MKDSARYLKVVARSEEDGCSIGTASGLFRGGCHGQDERAVFDELVEIVDEWIAHVHVKGEPLSPATAGQPHRLISVPQPAAE
ncbi:hypothetical protein N1F89_10140 [Aquibium sp. A9E412]|uniref:hypothetical protein n=1 Tax=Aquibium sp. A9E412 TaxID=2976767 RepID=UPI0025B1A064|nr:hypothetical protein [Aquibium sp. A9E412]MDN2566581.1 hypothetical protein [Aquibium sp. A9E412]